MFNINVCQRHLSLFALLNYLPIACMLLMANQKWTEVSGDWVISGHSGSLRFIHHAPTKIDFIIPQSFMWVFSSLTHTNLIVHESFQALDEFVLVSFINILLPRKKTNIKQEIAMTWKEHQQNLERQQWFGDEMSWRITHCFLSRSFSKASRSRPRPSWPKLLTQLKRRHRWGN